MKKFLTAFAAAVTLGALASPVFAEDPVPYTEGHVLDISYIKIKPGMFDAYMKFLDTTWKTLMEEQKKAGVIVSYGVYQAYPRHPHEPDLVLVMELKDMGSYDGLEARMAAIERKVWATRDVANKAEIERGAMREELGGEVLRELKLK